MKVAILFEHSGTVRDAFISLGHEAISFDLLPTETPGTHIICDLTKDISFDYWKQFDLAICHPPCTYLTYAGIRYWNSPGRDLQRLESFNLFTWCFTLPIEKICVENPVGLPNTIYRKPDQIIHPFYFGDSEYKRTCLWLKNLPLLEYSNSYIKPQPKYFRHDGKKIHFVEAAKGERWKVRSKTFESVANAMANQWSNINYEQLRFI